MVTLQGSFNLAGLSMGYNELQLDKLHAKPQVSPSTRGSSPLRHFDSKTHRQVTTAFSERDARMHDAYSAACERTRAREADSKVGGSPELGISGPSEGVEGESARGGVSSGEESDVEFQSKDYQPAYSVSPPRKHTWTDDYLSDTRFERQALRILYGESVHDAVRQLRIFQWRMIADHDNGVKSDPYSEERIRAKVTHDEIARLEAGLRAVARTPARDVANELLADIARAKLDANEIQAACESARAGVLA